MSDPAALDNGAINSADPPATTELMSSSVTRLPPSNPSHARDPSTDPARPNMPETVPTPSTLAQDGSAGASLVPQVAESSFHDKMAAPPAQDIETAAKQGIEADTSTPVPATNVAQDGASTTTSQTPTTVEQTSSPTPQNGTAAKQGKIVTSSAAVPKNMTKQDAVVASSQASTTSKHPSSSVPHLGTAPTSKSITEAAAHVFNPKVGSLEYSMGNPGGDIGTALDDGDEGEETADEQELKQLKAARKPRVKNEEEEMEDNNDDEDEDKGHGTARQRTISQVKKARPVLPALKGRLNNLECIRVWYNCNWTMRKVSKKGVVRAYIAVYDHLRTFVAGTLPSPADWDVEDVEGQGPALKSDDGTGSKDMENRIYETFRTALRLAQVAFVCHPVVNAIALADPVDEAVLAKVHDAARKLYDEYDAEYKQALKDRIPDVDIGKAKALRKVGVNGKDGRIPENLGKNGHHHYPGQSKKEDVLKAPLKSLGAKATKRKGSGSMSGGTAKKRQRRGEA